jgi:hypothetical protein
MNDELDRRAFQRRVVDAQRGPQWIGIGVSAGRFRPAACLQGKTDQGPHRLRAACLRWATRRPCKIQSACDLSRLFSRHDQRLRRSFNRSIAEASAHDLLDGVRRFIEARGIRRFDCRAHQ